jgi:hypothetical protein
MVFTKLFVVWGNERHWIVQLSGRSGRSMPDQAKRPAGGSAA